MAAQEEDYLLRQIEILGRIIARLMGRRDPGEEEHALMTALNLQEKLFGMPPAEFLRRDAIDQVAALAANESPEAAREKCLTYATLLRETASLYQLRGQNHLATGARQLALNIALLTALEQPSPAADSLVVELSARLAGTPLHAPVQALQDEFARRAGA